MALRRFLGRLAVMALAFGAWTACNDKGGAGGAAARCEQLAKACGEKDKHVETLVAECTQAAQKPVESGCTEQTLAVYDCYEKELCGKGDKVWSLDDLRVLADRHDRCVAERTALVECAAKK